jgi:hypothetical protein
MGNRDFMLSMLNNHLMVSDAIVLMLYEIYATNIILYIIYS